MYVLMIRLLCSALYGISGISKPGLKTVNFAKEIVGWKLNGSVISGTKVFSEGSCWLECVEQERCQSYNFGPTESNSEKFLCQLSDSDRFIGDVNFTEDKDFLYRGIKVVMK